MQLACLSSPRKGKSFRVSGTRWKGKPLTHAMGHSFEEDLNCKWCGFNWNSHKRDPQECQIGKRELDNKAKKAKNVIPIKPERTG